MNKVVLILILALQTCTILVPSAPLNVAVFCSADDKVSPELKTVAKSLGETLGREGFGLVTGGSCTGLMKEVIDGYVLSALTMTSVYGVLPTVLKQYNVQHTSIPESQLLWVDTMHARLATFHELSDIIVVLPGGFGTLHELMDFLVHNQFALTKKTIILLNYKGFWDDLLALFQNMQDHKLLAETHKKILSIASSLEDCVHLLLQEPALSTHQGLNSHYWEQR